MVKLASTCRWFHGAIMQDSLWKFACLNHLQVPAPERTEFKWIELYASAINGSHSYTFRDKEKHLDWMRIGAFFLDSASAILTQRLTLPLKIKKRDPLEIMLASNGACLLTDLRRGIWIADLQLVRCPVCQHDTCEGTMQTLDARHIELFLSEGYQNGSWVYDQIGSHEVKGQAYAASAAMLDLKHITDRETADVFNSKLWTDRPDPYHPKAMISYHHVAISTHLQENQGLVSKYYVMRAGTGGEVVSVRISQQLL
ncbi:Probable F-box protein At3g61730 [Linum perenne]